MRAGWCFLLGLSLWIPLPSSAGPQPLQLGDVLAWKRILTPIVSSDGQWFAYKLVPNEGDAEVVVTQVATGKEQRFAIGEVVRPNPFQPGGPPPPEASLRPRDLAFSENAKWLAFTVHPTEKQQRALRKAHKPIEDKVVLVELGTQKKTEYERIKRFGFSGQSSSVLALHRASPAPAPGPATSDAPASVKADEKPLGSDLIVVDLATGSQLSIGNVADFAFDKKGQWLAWIVDAQDKLGNGIELRDLTSGAVMPLDSGKAVYKSLTWTDKGDGLTAVRGTEDKHWTDKVYSLLAFKSFRASAPPDKFVLDPSQEKDFPAGMTVSAERHPQWMADLSEVTFGIHQLTPRDGNEADGKATAKTDEEQDKPDLVIWHWKDRRLQSMQQVQETRDKNFSYLCAWQPGVGKMLRLADEGVRDVSLAPEAKFGLGSDVREYELEANLDGRRYQDLYRVDPQTGERKLLLTKVRWAMGLSPDGTHLVHYADGSFLSTSLLTGQTRNITAGIPTSFIDTEDDHNVVKPPTREVGWSSDSRFVLLSDNWDIWKIPVEGGAALNLTGNGRKEKIRYQTIWRLDPDEKGYDFSKPLYIRAYGEWSKKGGIARVTPGQTGAQMLHWDDAAYANLLKAKSADIFVYSRETTQETGDYYAASAELKDAKKLTDADPQLRKFSWTQGTKLVEYTGPKGDRLQGVLYLPANYEPGKSYPTVVYIYEKLSQAANMFPTPGMNGFSVGYYTSNGYAVLTPDITYRVNDPGVSSIACILAALKAAEATGVVDASRVALHGHSWGGYQTAFAVTQTKVFKAAIAGAPLTDMISMYSSIYWNTGSANQPIFESSQGRFTGGYWEQMDAYRRNSPVYYAAQVQTPLLILHNDRDGAVDHTQGIEYYNTLRRLHKPVVMLEYKGENHGLYRIENLKDYTVRMKEFFDFYLMDKPAPKWWTDGVPRLKMADELKARGKQQPEAALPAAASADGAGVAKTAENR